MSSISTAFTQSGIIPKGAGQNFVHAVQNHTSRAREAVENVWHSRLHQSIIAAQPFSFFKPAKDTEELEHVNE